MKNVMQIFAIAVCYITSLPVFAQLGDEAVYQKVVGSVFTIKTDNGQGSAFAFKDGMTLVTNYHVIAGATTAKAIPADNKNVSYEVVGVIAADVEQDVAVLKIRGTYRTPIDPAINLPRVAQKVYAIGSPLGFEATFSAGIVSGIRENEIQHTAPISSGSSGGALLNEFGNLLGMNTKQVTNGQNLNFAISLATIQSVMKNEHKLVSIAAINQYHGTEVEEVVTVEEEDEEETTDVSSDLKPFFHMTFTNGNTLHEGIFLGYEQKFIVRIRYKDLTVPGGYDVIQETCDISLADATDASQKWAKIVCTDPTSVKKQATTNYLPDTFWLNKETQKMLLSDGSRDSKGNLKFVPVATETIDDSDFIRLWSKFD